MPSTTSSSVSSDFASSTVMTPSLPTFFMASARKRPMSASPLAEMVPTWAISSLEVTFFEFFCRSRTTASIARSMPRLRVHSGSDCFSAFPDDRVSEDRGSRRAIARDVGCFGCDLAHHLCAHIFELVLELDFRADRHSVLRDARRTVGFVEHDVAAYRTERDADSVREGVNTTKHLVACIDGKSNFLGRHVINSSKESICLHSLTIR